MISNAAIYVFHLNISTTASLMLLLGMLKTLSPRDYTSQRLIQFYYLGLEGHMTFISINNTSKRSEICFGALCKNKFKLLMETVASTGSPPIWDVPKSG